MAGAVPTYGGQAIFGSGVRMMTAPFPGIPRPTAISGCPVFKCSTGADGRRNGR